MTPTQESTLRSMWGSGATAREIGIAIGMETKTVGNKIYQLGITRGVKPTSPRAAHEMYGDKLAGRRFT